MKKNVLSKTILLLAIFLFSFVFKIDGVKAANGLCNIGFGKENLKGYGYYTATPLEPKPGTATFLDGYKVDKTNCKSGWCDKVHYNVTMNGDLAENGSKITNYTIYFLDDNGNRLCSITPRNGGFGLEPSSAGISLDFHFESGHVSKIEVAYKYTNSKGESIRNPKKEDKYKSFSVKKRVGDTGSIKNPTNVVPSTSLPTFAVDGYYMCNTTTLMSVSNTQECIKKKAGDSLGNCESKVFKDKSSCEKELKVTTITTTTAPTTANTAGTMSTNKAGYATGTPKTGVYDPSKSDAKCSDVSFLINKYWKYVMILVPIVLILLITIDFVKAIVASDADQLKKTASTALKRTLATVILLILPALLSVILNWFGLELCL